MTKMNFMLQYAQNFLMEKLMDIFQFADEIGKELIIRRYPRQSRFICEFVNGEIKERMDSCALVSEYGDGKTVNDAVLNYVDKIRGKILVFNAMSSNLRIVLLVPKNLKTKKV